MLTKQRVSEWREEPAGRQLWIVERRMAGKHDSCRNTGNHELLHRIPGLSDATPLIAVLWIHGVEAEGIPHRV